MDIQLTLAVFEVVYVPPRWPIVEDRKIKSSAVCSTISVNRNLTLIITLSLAQNNTPYCSLYHNANGIGQTLQRYA